MDLPGNSGITVIPTGASLGVDIVGVDLSQAVDGAQFKAIKEAWHSPTSSGPTPRNGGSPGISSGESAS